MSALHDPSPFTGILEHTMQLTIKTFLGAALTVAMTLGTQNAHAQSSRFDLLLKGGHVIDPANHLDGTFDVAVSGGKIAAVEKDIPAVTERGRLSMSLVCSSRRAWWIYTPTLATGARR